MDAVCPMHAWGSRCWSAAQEAAALWQWLCARWAAPMGLLTRLVLAQNLLDMLLFKQFNPAVLGMRLPCLCPRRPRMCACVRLCAFELRAKAHNKCLRAWSLGSTVEGGCGRLAACWERAVEHAARLCMGLLVPLVLCCDDGALGCRRGV